MISISWSAFHIISVWVFPLICDSHVVLIASYNDVFFSQRKRFAPASYQHPPCLPNISKALQAKYLTTFSHFLSTLLAKHHRNLVAKKEKGISDSQWSGLQFYNWLHQSLAFKCLRLHDFPSPCVIEFSICELYIQQTYLGGILSPISKLG